MRRRGIALIMAVLLAAFFCAHAEEDDLDQADLIEEPRPAAGGGAVTAVETGADGEIVEEVDLDPPGPATDVTWHTPNERSERICDHAVCFWKMKMGEMDEAAIWRVLTQPVTVLEGKQRQQIRVLAEPRADCEDYTGVVTCASQAVHILERGEEWMLIEAYCSAEEGSALTNFALPFQGYVKTSLLREEEVDQTYGLVIDKLQQRLYVFREGKLFSTLLCSTGFPREDTPFAETPAGEYLMISWVGGFWAGDLFCDMGMRINSGILIHEVPCKIEKNEATGEEIRDFSRCERYLGDKASHGCIRVQREKTPEMVNAKWLWDNLNRKPYTKVIIWDEIGRELGYPDDDYVLYYNPDGGKNYHSQETCAAVLSKFEPMTPFRYGELEETPYSRLSRCPACAPQLRREEIDTVNRKNNRKAE